MSGGRRCNRKSKMNGMGPDRGCGTDERPSRNTDICRVSGESTLCNSESEKKVDFFAQAQKALSEHSPFDVVKDDGAESGSTSVLGAGVGSNVVSTLPSRLASVFRPSDGSRKRHKKVHSGTENGENKKKKKKSKVSERYKGSIWVDTEEYFRDLNLADIGALFEVCSPLKSLATKKCFLVPFLRNEAGSSVLPNEKIEGAVSCTNADKVEDSEKTEGTESPIDMVCNSDVNDGNENENGNCAVAESLKEGDGQLMDIDSVGVPRDGGGEANCLGSGMHLSSGLNWLLGCRNRDLLTSERPSKKRKLLGAKAGLEKVITGSSHDGDTLLCDFCCKDGRDFGQGQLVVCSSCKAAVHSRCYGLQEDLDNSWICSWCRHRLESENSDLVEQPCVLCPKQGGALKSIDARKDRSVVEFAHLFCSLWMPEVYVEDPAKMEPIMNVGEIKEIRWKLVCNICKVKRGTCIRCSHGSCRTSFHPICARDARHRMEVWGKHGSDDVELRAFCLRHSKCPDVKNKPESEDPLSMVGSEGSIPTETSAMLTNNQQKSNICQTEAEIADHVEAPRSGSDSLGNCVSGQFDSNSNTALGLDCRRANNDVGEKKLERTTSGETSVSNSLNVALLLKKLIDREKVNVKDIALELGISADSLNSSLNEDSLVPDLQCKIVEWLRSHAFMGALHKSLIIKLKSASLTKAEMGMSDHFGGVPISEFDNGDHVDVKSTSPRRIKSKNVMLGDNNMITAYEDITGDTRKVIDEAKVNELACREPDKSRVASKDDAEKRSINLDGFHDFLEADVAKSEGSCDDPSDGRLNENAELVCGGIAVLDDSTLSRHGNLVYSDMSSMLSHLIKLDPSTYVHPSINRKLLENKCGVLSDNRIGGSQGSTEELISRLEASSKASVCCNHQNNHSSCCDVFLTSNGVDSEKLIKAKNMGIYELSPEDEVEGEIVYIQHKLLDNAIGRKRYTDNLVSKVAAGLPQEIDSARSQKWDAVLVNQYLYDLKKAKQQGRKERRHKEAQAVLAAATAAAAASSRTSFRKDMFDESAHQEKLSGSSSRMGPSSPLIPRSTETLSRVATRREKQSETLEFFSDVSKERPRSCDICRRSETMLNPILVCSSCKVAVHMDCYCSVKESAGPWHCEFCEELLRSQSSGPPVNFWEKPYFVAECGLCAGTSGAFRKSASGEWVHAFCAEWVFEHTFRRGQVNPVQGMDTIVKGTDICCICHRKQGVCIKCSYGHCQTAFHPNCARSTGLYMNVKTHNGKLQHKAYCEKHSLEQKEMAETQKFGAEEMKNLKQIRVELERIRLLCERIVKREKIKRDLVLCSHSILACKRDHAARSMLAHGPFSPRDVSSESATTSLRTNTYGHKSCSDTVQRSDDGAVDSAASVRHWIKVTMSMEADQKTDGSSTSTNLFTPKPLERVRYSGKQIPQRHSLTSQNVDDGEWGPKSRKHVETFEKELVMTSDQASMKNQQLPKGYIYIPVDCLPKQQKAEHGASSAEQVKGHTHT